MSKHIIITASVLFALTGCTGTLPSAFRLAQQEETFDAQSKIDISTKIDLLWVVDNSASMDVSQQKLRDGFVGFAQKYMKPTWDIRVAVITTDTFLANDGFNAYLGGKITGNNYSSAYINSRLASWQNPSWNTSLLNKGNGKFENGIRLRELWPALQSGYGRLLPGKHDGPTPALCYEHHSYFFSAMTNCRIRDNVGANTGVANCLNPGAGEASATQCVNTVQNDTVRSGKAIIETMPPAGTLGDSAWTNQLINDFMINVTTGSAGHGSERGLASLMQLINDNEASATAFFRPGSLRGIIFVSDEDDQSLAIPATLPVGFGPWTNYQTPCATTKTVDGFTYRLSTCADPAQLIDVATMKTSVDTFMSSLDGAAAQPNYFVVTIHPMDGASIQSLQGDRVAGDNAAGNSGDIAVNRADRYVEFGNLVGNGSLEMNIAASDYSPILDAIGNAIIQKKSTFRLNRAPTVAEQMVVKVLHGDGTETIIPSTKYSVSGKDLMITDYSIILAFAATDQILINYEPKTVY